MATPKQGAPDLAVAPVADAAMPQAHDLAMGGGSPGTSFSLDAVSPPSGPTGAVLTLSGAGFQSGDVVELSGKGLTTTVLAVTSLTATAIVVAVPSLSITTPAPLSVDVRRGTATSDMRPFELTGGHIYYLSPSGSDSAAGTINAPWKTVTASGNKMSAGDLAYLRGGTYSGQAQMNTSGTASAPIVFTGYPGESPLLDEPSTNGNDLDTLRVYGSYVVVDHIRVTDHNNPGQAIWIDYNAQHVTISNCEVFGSHGQGIEISGDNNMLWRNSIHDNGSHTPFDHGIYVEGGGNIIRSNAIYNNWTFGIQLYYGNGGTKATNVVEYNYIFHNGYGAQGVDPTQPSAGIVVAYAHPDSIVRYNRFCDNAQYGIYLIDTEPGTLFTGNVTCYNHSGGTYLRYPGSGTVLDGTISYNDSAFALYAADAVTSDNGDYFRSGGSAVLDWRGTNYSTLAAFQKASGQDGASTTADPKFTNVPSSSFDSTKALSYDFCTPVNKVFCSPAP